MTFEVLQSMQQIREGQRTLRRRKLSFATPAWKAWLMRHGLMPARIRIGDELKSWDVLKTANFIEACVPKARRCWILAHLLPKSPSSFEPWVTRAYQRSI
jgi:hypothetical protein